MIRIPDRRNNPRAVWLAVGWTVWLLAAPAGAQSDDASDPDQDDVKETIRTLDRNALNDARNRPISPTEAEQGVEIVAALEPLPPLVREGAYLTAVAGKMSLDTTVGFWVFDPVVDEAPGSPIAAPARFIVLPCAKLSEMQRAIEATELDVIFKMTGRVFVFEDVNYLLPLTVPILAHYETPPTVDRSDSPNPPDAPPVNPGDVSVEELIANIRREVPAARSLAHAVAEDAESTTDTAEGSARLRREGTIILSRRGHVVRTAGGAWRFVFTTDATGLSDPPMTLLPCLLLERLGSEVSKRGGSPTLLMSGEVQTYLGHNYLVPTFYEVERTQRNLRR